MPDKKRMNEEEIVNHLLEDIKAGQDVADIESEQNAKLYKYYRAKTMDNEVKGRSQIVDSTVFETVEWIMPALEDIFSEENGIPEFEPVGPEDEDAAEKMSHLCRYQFWRQSDGVIPLRLAMKKGLLFRPGGVVKYCWETDEEVTKKKWGDLTPEDVLYLQSKKGYEITSLAPREDGLIDAEGLFRDREYDGPRFYSVPDGEFLRHPNARDIKTSPFVAHKTKITADELRRRKGTPGWKNIDAVLDSDNAEATDGSIAVQEMNWQDGMAREKEPSSDPARKEYVMYECYVRLDTDGDGLLENRKICLINRTIIYDEINEYKYPPFIKLCSIDDIDKFSGIPISEMVMDIQRARTFVLRQLHDNMAQANNSRKVFDPTKINQADLLLNIPGAPIRTKSGVDVRTALTELVTQPFNPVAFSVLEYQTSLAEQRTGVSKAVKSVGDQYNETFSGQMAALNQASQRIRMIAKIMATGMADLFRAMVYMNKRFLTQETSVRLNGDFIKITPDDLEGRMDLIIHVIMGQASRQQTVVNIQQTLATLGQLQASTMMPMLDGNNTPNLLREMYKAFGWKNPDRFLPLIFQQDPMMANEAIAQIQQMNMMMGGKNGTGGATIGSLAGEGGGGVSTTNPSGAGLPAAAIQPGSG